MADLPTFGRPTMAMLIMVCIKVVIGNEIFIQAGYSGWSWRSASRT